MANGVYTYIQEQTRNETVLVNTSSKTLSDARNSQNPRKNIVIRNISPNAADIITVNLGFSNATNDAGIVLNQNEAFSDTTDLGYECYQGVITIICATANGKVAVYER